MFNKKIFNKILTIALCVSVMLSSLTLFGCNPTSVDKTFKDTDIVLCENGVSTYKILLPNSCTTALSWAGDQVKTYIKKSTGADLEVVYDNTLSSTSTEQKFISIGETTLFNTLGVSIKQEELTTDGYKIILKNNSIFICGNRDWGTTFGVFEFLNIEIGFEPYTSTEIYYEEKEVLMVKDFGTYVDVPAFEGRFMDGIGVVDPTTSYYLRTISYYGNGEARFNGTKSSAWLPGPDHTITMILPEKEYPSYYETTTQLCFSNEQLFNDMKKELIEIISANPLGYIVNVGQEDGKGYCECTQCLAEQALYTTSGYWVRFMNRLVSAIEEWRLENCPERYLMYATYAYGGTLSPPVKLNDKGAYVILDESCRPHEKLYMKITVSGCGLHSMYDDACEVNVNVRSTYEGWASITDRFMAWDYAANYINYLPFFNDIDLIQSSYDFYRDKGVINMFTELNSGGSVTGFGWLRLYLRAKCMWNPDQDIESLIDNFFANYYKETAIYMRQVFDLYRSHQKAIYDVYKYHIRSITYIDTKMWPRNIVDQAEQLILKALEVCDNMSDKTMAETLRLRIEEELVCVQLLQLYFYKDYGYDTNSYANFLNQFEQKTIAMNITKYREHESMADWLKSLKNAM